MPASWTSPRISTEAEPFNGLLFLNVAQVVDLVPVMGRLLEIQVGRGGLHIADQFLDDFRVLALQEERGATHVGTVVLGEISPTQGAVQRLIWYCRQGRLRLRK